MEIELQKLVELDVHKGVFVRDDILDAATLPDYIHEGRGKQRYFLKQCGKRRLKLTVSVDKEKIAILKAQWVHTE